MFMDKTTHIINMSVFPNLIYRVNAVIIKIPTSFFLIALEKQTFIFIQRGKET